MKTEGNRRWFWAAPTSRKKKEGGGHPAIRCATKDKQPAQKVQHTIPCKKAGILELLWRSGDVTGPCCVQPLWQTWQCWRHLVDCLYSLDIILTHALTGCWYRARGSLGSRCGGCGRRMVGRALSFITWQAWNGGCWLHSNFLSSVLPGAWLHTNNFYFFILYSSLTHVRTHARAQTHTYTNFIWPTTVWCARCNLSSP